MQKHTLTIGWLYYDLMNTYGDRGNVMILKDRCLSRGINATVKLMTLGDPGADIAKCDLLFMGGAQDRQQSIVQQDIASKKEFLANAIARGTPGVYVCGAYQLLGEYYMTANGQKIDGLGIFNIYTEAPKSKQRLIGDAVVHANIPGLANALILGFENHGGRTHLEKGAQPFGIVRHGHGNNGQDKTEGIIQNNSIGTYLHGPIFSKNAELADWLISRALEKKYEQKITLNDLDDEFEQMARNKLLGQYS